MKLKPFVATSLLMAVTLGSHSALAAEQKDHELFANINLASKILQTTVRKFAYKAQKYSVSYKHYR